MSAPITAHVVQLFQDAADAFERDMYSEGTHYYLEASDLLPHVPEPLDYLQLVCAQRAMLLNFVLPHLLAV